MIFLINTKIKSKINQSNSAVGEVEVLMGELQGQLVVKFLDGCNPIAVVPKLYKAQTINLYWDSRTTRSNFGPRNIL
jgi:hypothetical protein